MLAGVEREDCSAYFEEQQPMLPLTSTACFCLASFVRMVPQELVEALTGAG